MIQARVKGLPELLREFEKLPQQLRNANRSAARKAATWTRTQGRRAVAVAHGIPQAALTRRKRTAIKVQAVATGAKAKAWFGVVPLKGSALGTAKLGGRRKGGVRIGRHAWPSGFLIPKVAGKGFRRKRASRFPITEVTLALDKAEAALGPVASRAASEYERLQLAELDKVLRR